ncbi:MAG TPA: cytochrome c biogenesis protein CcsA [Spirochaetota bacterium]|nr:cytochrome c biogenesis protein CcsA [Spirochaetota bacterium]
MNIYRLVFIFMPVVIYMALIWAPPAAILGDASRILYFHVPVAWVSIVAFLVAGINSIILLVSQKNRKEREFMAHNSAVAGMVFIILALITGSIWAKLSWGSYWNWDPRETSIVILMLIYIAYLSLYSSLKDNPNRGSISAVYLIIAMITMPFLVFIIPRIYPSLHPDTIINQERKIHLEAAMRITLFASIVTFTLLYGYIYRLMNRISALEIKAEEKHYDI